MRTNDRPVPEVIELDVGRVKARERSARKHSRAKLQKLRAAIGEFGFINPILVDEGFEVIAGNARLAAARDLGMKSVPAIVLSGLSEAQKAQLRVSDNKLVLEAKWDVDVLAEELRQIIEADADPVLTGFDIAEIDALLLPEPIESGLDDEPDPPLNPVSRLGDRWLCGEHVVVCGDATDADTVAKALGGELAGMCFTDPPYGVRIARNVSGHGKIKHGDFVMGAGEQSKEEFAAFLKSALILMARHAKDGAVHYVCMDWRSVATLIEAGRDVFDEMLNLCVWAKTNAGMGSFYRSQHELVAVFKSGGKPHINNIQLGRLGRYRTNVWTYPGNSSNTKTRGRELSEHPTVKPVAMIADAIRDATAQGELIFDPFGGSGSTLVAAHSVRRRAALIELDPRYVDVILQRIRRMTGQQAVLDDGRAFEVVRSERLVEASREVPNGT